MTRPLVTVKLVDAQEERNLLLMAHDWLAAANDGEEGVDWLNGQSAKYQGDAWKHAEKLQRELRRHLKIAKPEKNVYHRKEKR